MRKITLNELAPGMKLAKDVILEDGRFLLLKGFTIKSRYLDRIRHYSIPYLYVEDEIGKIEHFSEEVVYTETFQTIKSVMDSVRDGGTINLPVLKDTVDDIVQRILNDDNVFMKLTGIRDIDNYTYLHSVDVCIYSVVAGKSMHLSHDEIANLGLGAILHDMGKCKIPLDILNKPARLTKYEYEIIKKHTVLGYEIIRNTPGVSHSVANIALCHHEHWDGTGYPLQRAGRDIDILSRIVAVADVYDALTANRVYRKRFMPHEAAEYIIANAAQHFDPEVLKVFLDNIAVYPADIIVMLNTGEIARVVEARGLTSIRPKVMVITRKEGPPVLSPYEIDLQENKDVFIVDILS
ncbi:MAG: HD domain-containing protein [Thermoclostridium sp.]|nr:HD domain-containing protein [Thermoclostridium sp.]